MTPMRPLTKKVGLFTISAMVLCLVVAVFSGPSKDSGFWMFVTGTVGLSGLVVLLAIEIVLPDVQREGFRNYLLAMLFEGVVAAVIWVIVTSVFGPLTCN